ncbi:MAG: hypothetical protein WAN86_01240 [Hyphomicrobiaceae bacterium]
MRLARIVGGYLAACVVAGLAMSLVAPLWDVHTGRLRLPQMTELERGAGNLLLMTTVVAGFGAVIVFIPAAIVVAIAEALRLRSSVFYAGAGVVAVMVGFSIFARNPAFPWSLVTMMAAIPKLILNREYLMFFWAPGVVGGLVYWWIAGRTAGSWRVAQGVTP